jgi:adenylate cyclase
LQRRHTDNELGDATLRGGESIKSAESARRAELLKFAWQAALIAAISALLVYGASRYTAYSDLDAWTYDFTALAGSDQSVSKDIVFVDFDEESFRRIAVFPIPRSLIAELVTRIGAMRPKIIGMDILLSEPRSDDEDKAMQTALTSAGVVILAAQKGQGILPPEVPLAKFCQPEEPKAASGFCKDGTPGALGYGFIDLVFSDDGFIRKANVIDAGPPRSESFPLMLAEQYTGRPLDYADRKIFRFLGKKLYFADGATSTMLIGSWQRHPVTTIPAWKILAGEVPADALAGKLVLIGQTNDAARDTDFTPLYRHAENGVRLKQGGTEIHAAAIRSLLEGTVVEEAPQSVLWAWVLVVSWASSFLLLALRPGWGVFSTAMLMTVPTLLSIAFYAEARYWLPFLPVQLSVAATLPLSLGLQFVLERIVSREAHEQRRQMMTLFSSYVDPAVAQTIWERRSEVSLSGEERVATVVFTDIRNFTKLSAGKPPAEVLKWLNMYVTAMDKVIRDYDGFLNKFIGDGLMIIFGLPLSQGPSEDARMAVEASLAMLERVEALNRENANDPTVPQLRIGIGLHTGSLMAGSIGSASRQEYSVIGATVNLASRLESLNKPYKTEILMSQATRDMVSNQFTGIRPLGDAKVAGLEEEIAIYTIEAQEKYRAMNEILTGDVLYEND